MSTTFFLSAFKHTCSSPDILSPTSSPRYCSLPPLENHSLPLDSHWKQAAHISFPNGALCSSNFNSASAFILIVFKRLEYCKLTPQLLPHSFLLCPSLLASIFMSLQSPSIFILLGFVSYRHMMDFFMLPKHSAENYNASSTHVSYIYRNRRIRLAVLHLVLQPGMFQMAISGMNQNLERAGNCCS